MGKTTITEHTKGVWFGLSSYFAWGILPLYWKALEHVPSSEILAHRIIWSFVFVLLLIILSKKWSFFVKEFKNLFIDWITGITVLVAAILITGNWFTYIWAVNHDHVIETSLGYYVSPLFSVLLGIVFLKEKLTFWQQMSLTLAGIGVLVLTLQYGNFPWIALILASSFGLYGLSKKLIKLNALFSLTFETMFVTPIALLFVAFWHFDHSSSFATISFSTTMLLIGAGVATALPLLWYSEGAKRIPLSTLGFLQYISPTITLLLGIFLFNERFMFTDLLGFSLIWIALIIFTASKSKFIATIQAKSKKNKSIGA